MPPIKQTSSWHNQIKVHITKTGKENELNEVQIYTHCLACYSMLVDAEAEVAEAPIFMCKLFSLVSILTQWIPIWASQMGR